MGNPSFSHRCTIYWEDTDAGGVVYYANYLKFMERCRTEWLRALGVDQRQLRAERQLQFAVVHVAVDFLRPAILNDEIIVTAELAQLERCDNFLQANDTARRRAAHRRDRPRRLSRFGTLKPRAIPKDLFTEWRNAQ